jgi:hypothetical protein
MAEPNKIIYSMVGVGKFYDKKPVLKDIYLSYFYGAKIGVLGLNGSGKSSSPDHGGRGQGARWRGRSFTGLTVVSRAGRSSTRKDRASGR